MALPEHQLDPVWAAPQTSRRRFPVAGSGKSLGRGPQNVKEQARERRTRATLPQFYGNATFIFSEFTAEHAGYAEMERGRISVEKGKGNGRGMNGRGMKTAQSLPKGFFNREILRIRENFRGEGF